MTESGSGIGAAAEFSRRQMAEERMLTPRSAFGVRWSFFCGLLNVGAIWRRGVAGWSRKAIPQGPSAGVGREPAGSRRYHVLERELRPFLAFAGYAGAKAATLGAKHIEMEGQVDEPSAGVGREPAGSRRYQVARGLKRLPPRRDFVLALCAVLNRTTGKPQANVVLDLLSPTQGMAELATVTSDAQGRFSVTKDSIGMAPILIRATFHDVSFNTFAPPGRPNIDVNVYDISKDPKGITVPQHVVIFESRNDKLIGAEEYTVQNNSQPPSAYFRSQGNFDFAIPEHGTLAEVSTTEQMGVPVNQASIDKGKGRYAIAFAFRPGETNVRLSYELPYPNNAATLKLPATYAGAKLLVVVPPGITVTGEGLTSAGQEQGMLVYTHDALAAKGVLTVSVSGVGTAQAAGDDQGQGQGQENAQEGNSRQEQGPQVIAAPSRLNDFKWFLFAGLAAIFAMGALLLSRKQVIVAGDGEDSVAGPASKGGKAGAAGKAKKAQALAAGGSGNAKSGARSDVSAVVDNHVAQTMESLKDQIFRLELRRQAGTISEEEYAKEKGRFDQLLKDLVQG